MCPFGVADLFLRPRRPVLGGCKIPGLVLTLVHAYTQHC